MKPYQILTGNCLRLVKQLPANSVHCIVTSPPYWGLRDYGVKGQLGQEQTPDLYVAHLVKLFRRLRRVLRDDGTVWLNLGDSYAGQGRTEHSVKYAVGKTDGQRGNFAKSRVGWAHGGNVQRVPPGLKPKDLIGIPWLVAFALRADGWYLRNDIIWHKPNPMPEAVTDRCTRAHEYLFLLTKRPRYYYDAEAIRESAAFGAHHAKYQGTYTRHKIETLQHEGAVNGKQYQEGLRRPAVNPLHRNKRSVWTIITRGFKEAHFATFPEALVEPCVQAGTSNKGCCPHCGAPWTRIVEKKKTQQTTDWRPTCQCRRHEPVPCTVLDPFNGAGTTGVVALKLRRRYVGIELKPDYVAIAQRRLRRTARSARSRLAPLFPREP